MKAVVFHTFSSDCENKWMSLQAAGHDVHLIQYDDRPHDRHGELVEEVRRVAPDFAVFIGACEQSHNRPVPNVDILRRIRDVTPFIHMCDDAADPPWWPQLQTYHDQACFTVQVSIDGGHDAPLSAFSEGMTLLTPVDTRVFSPRPWHEREIPFSFVGNIGGGDRSHVITRLCERGLLQFYQMSPSRSYADMAAIIGNSRFVFNHTLTGTGTRSHVKGRVVECGFAGAALIEYGPSLMGDWFRPDEYFAAQTIDEVEAIIRTQAGDDVAARFHDKVEREHHPRVFWDKVLTKACVL
jgi:hypothetical protein